MTIFSARLVPKFRSPLARMACVGLILQSLAACEQTRDAVGQGDSFPLQALQSLPLLSDAGTDLAGKTLLVNFWATWCAPCREEMPLLQQLSDSLDPARYVVIGVAVDEDANLVREFLLRFQIRFTNFQDASGNLATERLRLATFPQTFIVSPQGVITRRIDEAITLESHIFDKARDSGNDWLSSRPRALLDG